MTRLSAALLAAYVVTSSTFEVIGLGGNPEIWTERRVGTMQCNGTQEECNDLAEALNMARERRFENLWPSPKESVLLKKDCIACIPRGDAGGPCTPTYCE